MRPSQKSEELSRLARQDAAATPAPLPGNGRRPFGTRGSWGVSWGKFYCTIISDIQRK